MLKWLATFILIWFVYTVRHVFPPIIVGGIIAYLLMPLVQLLVRVLRLPKPLVVVTVYVTGVVIFVGLACWVAPGIVREVKELAASRHEIVHGVVTNLGAAFNWQGNADETTAQILGNIGESFSSPGGIVHLGGAVSHGFLSVLVCVVSSIFFTMDSDRVFKFFLRYFPEERRPTVIELTGQMNRILSRYLLGQLFLILFMSVVAYVFLHFFMHMKYALPVAILSGFLEVIPVLGPTLAIIIAALVAIAQINVQAAVIIAVFYWAARIFEDYVVVPNVMKHAVEMHPLAVIFAVLCGETMAGALGMLIAIPVAACIKLIIDFFYLGKYHSETCADNPQPGQS